MAGGDVVVGRAGAIGGDWQIAETYAKATVKGCERLLGSRELDADGEAPLPIALGAAIETLGKFYDAAGAAAARSAICGNRAANTRELRSKPASIKI